MDRRGFFGALGAVGLAPFFPRGYADPPNWAARHASRHGPLGRIIAICEEHPKRGDVYYYMLFRNGWRLCDGTRGTPMIHPHGQPVKEE